MAADYFFLVILSVDGAWILYCIISAVVYIPMQCYWKHCK